MLIQHRKLNRYFTQIQREMFYFDVLCFVAKYFIIYLHCVESCIVLRCLIWSVHDVIFLIASKVDFLLIDGPVVMCHYLIWFWYWAGIGTLTMVQQATGAPELPVWLSDAPKSSACSWITKARPTTDVNPDSFTRTSFSWYTKNNGNIRDGFQRYIWLTTNCTRPFIYRSTFYWVPN